MRIVTDDKYVDATQMLAIPLHTTAGTGTWALSQDASGGDLHAKSNLFGSGLKTVGKAWILEKIIMNVIETGVGTNGWEASIFFGIAALTNGLELAIYNSAGTRVADWCDNLDQPWKTAQDCATFGELNFPVMGVVTATASDLIAQLVIKPETPIYMPAGSYVDLNLQDDLTGLTELTCTAFGHLI